MSYFDQDYREIITKAVCGRGRKLIKDTNYVVPMHKPSSILGCWIINHQYHAKQGKDHHVEVHGSYDINIWYSFNDNTKTEVVSEKINYRDEVPLEKKDEHCLDDEYDIMVKAIQQPNCLQCKIEKHGNKIAVEVEREFVVKVIGETKVNVKVSPLSFRDERDDRFGGKFADDYRDQAVKKHHK